MYEFIKSREQLEELYGEPRKPSLIKEVDHLIPHYRRFIENSPFCILATSGPDGLDCSPRGDKPGFVRVRDEKTLLLPDRRGNNRVDSLRNIVDDGRVALLFIVPGHTNSLRVNGQAAITTDQGLCGEFEVDGKAPRSVVIVQVGSVFFQCGRALLRARLWDSSAHAGEDALPSAGEILAFLSKEPLDADEYDANWRKIAPETLW